MCAGGCAVGVDTRAPHALLVEPALLSFAIEVLFPSRFVCRSLPSTPFYVGRRLRSGGGGTVAGGMPSWPGEDAVGGHVRPAPYRMPLAPLPVALASSPP